MIKNKFYIFFLILIIGFTYYFFFAKRFDSASLMKENSSIIKLSSLTNFKWDYALISLTNEDFEKITFYKNGVKLYRDGFKVKSDGEIKSQYLFNYYSEKTKGFSTYKCPYSSSIKFRNVEYYNEGRVVIYTYEPIGCIPMIE
ncbi:hypothetical protein [Acinetobacter sp.]|uniref:hypothetical protein n=1 Tax=Acinetobacter sp. TaxID=472 RepID=UPI003C721F3A